MHFWLCINAFNGIGFVRQQRKVQVQKKGKVTLHWTKNVVVESKENKSVLNMQRTIVGLETET